MSRSKMISACISVSVCLCVSGIEAIVGVRGFGFWMNIFEMFNQKVMRPMLTRNPEMILDQKLFRKERKMSLSQGGMVNMKVFFYKHHLYKHHKPQIPPA